MHRVIVFAAVSAVAMLPLCGQELIYAPGKTMGLENVPPPERNRWKARVVRPTDYDRKEVTECHESDFFTLEYGAPLSPFTLELDAKGEASQLWGERANEHTGQAIRFGRGWSGYNFARTQVRAEIVQADSTVTVFPSAISRPTSPVDKARMSCTDPAPSCTNTEPGATFA